MEQNRKPRDKPTHLSLTKEARIYNGEKTISLTSQAGETGQPFVKDVKKAEHQRIDAFELWCWRRSLRDPLDCKEIKPVNPKENHS